MIKEGAKKRREEARGPANKAVNILGYKSCILAQQSPVPARYRLTLKTYNTASIGFHSLGFSSTAEKLILSIHDTVTLTRSNHTTSASDILINTLNFKHSLMETLRV